MKTKALCLLGFTFLLVVIAAFAISRKEAHAAGQVVIDSQTDLLAIYNPLFERIDQVSEIPANPAETEALELIFADALTALTAVKQTTPKGQEFRAAKAEIRGAVIDALEDFVASHPNSTWTPSLRNNLGLLYRRTGRHSLSLVHWQATWEMLKESQTPKTRKIADTAFAQWTSLLASLGRVETLTQLLEATAERDFGRGAIADLVNQTREAYHQMLVSPEASFRCGSIALANLTEIISEDPAAAVHFFTAPSPASGFSVKQLVDLAASKGISVVPVLRDRSEEIPVPSVVHWKQDHYAAIVDFQNGRYRVVDPTFTMSTYADAETINAEASGVFLVPASAFPASGFRVLSDSESASIFGRGNPNFLADPNDDGCTEECCDDGNGSSGSSGRKKKSGSGMRSLGSVNESDTSWWEGACDSCGMPEWRVSEPYMNLWVEDKPWSYRTSNGNAMTPKLAYKQRNTQNSYYVEWEGSTIDDTWNLSWLSQITYYSFGNYFDYAGVKLPSGGSPVFIGDPNDAAVPTRAYHSNMAITGDYDSGEDAVISVTLSLPDGSQLIYGTRRDYALGYGSQFLLDEMVAPDGSVTTFQYYIDPITDAALLTYIIDSDNRTNTFTYLSGTHHIETIESPNGQVLTLEYDQDVHLDYYLVGVTDAEGMESTFDYDGNGDLSDLATPYGTTSFDFSSYLDTDVVQRRVTITHPDASKECYLYYSSYNAANASYPTNEVPSGTPLDSFDNMQINHRNSWHWNRYQYANLSSGFKASQTYTNMTSSDKLKGHLSHWLISYVGDMYHYAVDTLALERLASPDGSAAGQVTWYDHANKVSGYPYVAYEAWTAGAHMEPAVIARVMPDGTTWYEYHQRNEWGHSTNVIEKWVENGSARYRTNRYVYAANGTDLLEHWGSHDGSEHRTEAYSYNAYHLPLTFTNALDEVTTYTYTGNKVSTVQTPSGLLSTYTYNGTSGLLEKLVDSVSGTPLRTNLYSWSYGLLDKHTNELGLVLDYSWDDLNRLIRIDYPDSSYIEHRYTNGLGDPIIELGASRDRLGQWTYFEYNNLRQRTKVVDPLGHITNYEYCSCGSPDYIREAFGTADEYVTQRAFDYQGRPTHTFQPGGINLTNTYDSLGRLTKISDALGSTTNYFDNLGRLTIVSNFAGLVQRAYYDDHGQVRTNIDANGVTTTLTYDDLHRLRTRTVNSAGTEAYGYTANISRPTSYTNQLGKVTQYAYHAAGWKTNEVIVGMATNKFSYDPAGNLRTLRDGKDQLTSWGYDPYARMASKTNDNNVVMLAYLYDANSRLTNRWSAAKGSTGYAYDAAGNLTNVNYPSSTDIQYAYDALNRMSTMVDASGTTTWTYDMTNRYSVEDGPWVSDNVTNRWNTAGQRDTMAIQQPHASSYFNTAYAYDAAKRLTNLTSEAGTYSYYYHPGLNGVTGSSRLVQRISLPNTSFITNSFDGAARWTDTYLKTSASATLNRHSYAYNAANQRTEQTVTDGSYYGYVYDDAGQLASAQVYTSGGAPTSALWEYAYDPAWNMTNRSISTTPFNYTVNSLNQLTSSGGTAHSYDDNGNMLTFGSNTSYEYDDENQLTAVEFIDPNSDNGWRSEFIYDGKLRMRRHLTYSRSVIAGTTYWNLSSERRMVYDGMLVVQDRDGSNVPTVTYTRGPDLSGTLDGAGGIGGMLGRSHDYSTATGAWASHNHYHADGSGNITYIVSSSQGLAGLYRYDPFGNSRGVLGAVGNANLYRFSSKMYIASHALYYYGYRFYSPTFQRWMNRDPMGENGGVNLYRFVQNACVSRVDPWGLEDFESQWPEPWVDAGKKIPAGPIGKWIVCIHARTTCIQNCEAEYGLGATEEKPDALKKCKDDCADNFKKCMGGCSSKKSKSKTGKPEGPRKPGKPGEENPGPGKPRTEKPKER